MRTAKTFTIDQTVLELVEDTKGDRSTSERVNQLLRRALELERRDALEREAASFYSAIKNDGREEERAFQKASARSLMRD